MLSVKDIFVGEILCVKDNDYDEYVMVHLIDEDNGQVYCSGETFGISMWYDIENLEKLATANARRENDDEIATYYFDNASKRIFFFATNEFIARHFIGKSSRCRKRRNLYAS